jgi:hypothetical protein
MNFNNDIYIFDDTLKDKKFSYFHCTNFEEDKGLYRGYLFCNSGEMFNVRIPETIYIQIPKQFKNNIHLGNFYYFGFLNNGDLISNDLI